ncbi:hypothetical protein CAPN001_08900 [Capnocytophaga stomatis]|uniref:DUF4199 domain-containing protein n=1 Tax=Capnocytophaga stomatis TaxID=1848904 RepID=UPI00195122AB|nr:DUF4199 domain-containing protein [Capnocytophaga stomatis]GIJ96321.1 hypothetical protein CAPN001_08900 [Capnocytophaga stomatis]
METNAVNSKNIMLKNGLYLGLTSIAMSVIWYATGNTYSTNPLMGTLLTIIGLGISIFFIVVAIKKFKAENNGYLFLSQALKIGIGVALIGGVIAAAYALLFTTVIEPDYFEKLLEVQRQAMIEANPNLTEQQLQAMGEMAEKFSLSPFTTFTFSIIGSLFSGLIISLIAGAVMQKKEQVY